MSVDLDNRSGITLDTDALVRQAEFLLQQLWIHPDTDLAVTLVDEDAMSELHVEWMDEPGPTDVLSFPMDELVAGTPDRPSGPGVLGDVVLCPQVAARQAVDAGLHVLSDKPMVIDGAAFTRLEQAFAAAPVSYTHLTLPTKRIV